MQLDLIVRAARIHTMDPARPSAERIGVWNGRIVGLDAELDGLRAAREVDLGPAVVLPGFVDAHTHLSWQGLDLGAVDVSGAASIDDIVAIVEAAARDSEAEWVDVAGYDQRSLGRHLTAADLDPVSHGHPVFVQHFSGHACVVNSAVLERADQQRFRADNPGIDRDAEGQPSGLFLEAGQEIVRDVRLPYSLAELGEAIERSARLCASQGITYCCEAGIGAGMLGYSPIELAAQQDLVRSGRLPVRLRSMIAGDALHELRGEASDPVTVGLDLGPVTGFGGDELSIGAMKLWLDGGMSARTAALRDPYAGSEHRGDLADVDGYRDLVVNAHRAGWQLALHAIGDRAMDAALDLIEASLTAHPRDDARPRIEHAGLVAPDQLERMARLGVTAVVQPSFLYEFGDDYAAVMGADRAPWMYRGQAFVDHGVRVVASSDRPVTPGAPLAAIGFMVTRRSRLGTPIGPDEAVDVSTALRAHTIDGAWICGVEDRVGSITPGKLADLTVLAADPHDVEPGAIRDIPVLATLLGGRLTHAADTFTATDAFETAFESRSSR